MTKAHAHIGDAKYATQVEVSDFKLTVDEPFARGGGSAGPAPYDLLLASLCACTAITLRMYAERKHWDIGTLDVDARLIRESGAARIERTLAAPAATEEQREKLADIAERTPVTMTLKAGIPIQTSFA